MTHYFSTGNGAMTLMLDPTVAADISRHGFKSKEDYAEYLQKNSKTPAWLYWEMMRNGKEQAAKGVEPCFVPEDG